MSKLAAVFLVLGAAPACAATWSFPAGAPTLAKNGGIAFPMDVSHYAAFVKQAKNHVAIVGQPPNLSSGARYGYNFVVSGRNRGWILDGDEERGWVLYLDWKGDGDLSAAEPRKLERGGGVYRLQVEVQDGELRWPCRFELTSVSMDGKEQLGVRIIDRTIRSGVIELEGRRFPFRLTGMRGIYDGNAQTLSVERFGTGDADSYKIGDRYLNLAGKSYQFRVDHLGNSLSLTELAETQPDRPSLKVGSAAPDIAALDLSEYRGRSLLVEFWSTKCGPCRAEAPRMVELYSSLSREKIEFLGISSDTSDQTLRDFLREFKMAWPQKREPFEGPLHQLYRVAAEPSYFLIGPDGQVSDAWIGSGETAAHVSKALGAQ